MNDISQEKRLWQAVVYRAFADATAESHGGISSREKQEAISWIKRGGRDYRRVVTMAGMDPDFLRDAFIGGRVDAKLLRHSMDR